MQLITQQPWAKIRFYQLVNLDMGKRRGGVVEHLEQGGPVVAEPVAVSEMNGPVASPFHSDKAKEEVALARSRPRTLDEDARKMGPFTTNSSGSQALSDQAAVPRPHAPSPGQPSELPFAEDLR